MKPNDRLITLQELCKRLSLSESTVRKEIRNGRLRGYNLGRWRFSQEQVDDYLSARESCQEPPARTTQTPHLLTRRPDGKPLRI